MRRSGLICFCLALALHYRAARHHVAYAVASASEQLHPHFIAAE